MSSPSHANKTHFHLKSCAPWLALKKRLKTTQKWPIYNYLALSHPLSYFYFAMPFKVDNFNYQSDCKFIDFTVGIRVHLQTIKVTRD